ncbi:hypothetical protein MKEN_00756600 [Mycena kentingensis (nom. inval.)]|nr:hypothetical protein MKEN_00756600 [Mycena kentingensis (nom. inval.)]
MDRLYRLFKHHRPILLRRPLAHDVDFASLHVPESTSDSLRGLHQETVLLLDFNDLDPSAHTSHGVASYVHEKTMAFLERTRPGRLRELDYFLRAAVPITEIVTCAVSISLGIPFVLMIENFDAISNPEVDLDHFFHHVERFTRTGAMKALVLFSSKEMSEPFPQHDHPKVPFGLQNVLDVTHHPAFQTAIGCTESDVRDLDNALAKTFPNAMGDIFELLRSKEVFPVSFVDPNWADLDPEDPLRAEELCTDGKDVGVYRFESVLDALNEKYELTTKNS